MDLMPVNDPELLKQLGAPTEDTPVSDPDLLRQLNGETAPEDPGMLKSAAAGVMSGVPLAETATAGIESLVNNTPYAKEHAALEALKDAAWDKHPYAYGAGKTAGIVGTGAVTGGTGIPGAIGIGAASGLDQADKLSDVPGDVMKGAAVGGVLGTLGEKVISPMISKIPGAAKSVLSTFGRDTTREGVDAYLANPDLINNAPGSVAQSEVLQTVANQLKARVSHLSGQAMNTLNPDSYTTLDELKPAFDQIRQKLMTEGEAGPAQQAAINAIEHWESMLRRIADRVEASGASAGSTAAKTVGGATYDSVQSQIDSLESTLEKEGIDIIKTPLEKLPEKLQKLYELRDSIGSQELKTSTDGVLAALNKAGITDPHEVSRILDGYALNPTEHGVAQQYHAGTYTEKMLNRPLEKQVEDAYVKLGLSRGIDVEGRPNPQLYQDAVNAVKAITDHFSGGSPEVGALNQAAPVTSGGKIPETVIGKLIRDIDANTNWADQSQAVTNNALKDLRHTLDAALKTSNPEYATAMQPVSETAKLLTDIKKNFGLKNEAGTGMTATDTTNSKMANVLNENKSNAQDVLKQAGKSSGVDFLANATNSKIQKSFESGSGGGLRTVLSGLGLGAGAMVGHPWIGGTMAGALSTQLDGGAIAKNILDMYIGGSKTMADAGVTKALQTFGPMLANAAKAGGNQLAATHFVLATSNPEYQSLVEHAQNHNQ